MLVIERIILNLHQKTSQFYQQSKSESAYTHYHGIRAVGYSCRMAGIKRYFRLWKAVVLKN